MLFAVTTNLSLLPLLVWRSFFILNVLSQSARLCCCSLDLLRSKEMECRCDQDRTEDAVPGEKDPPVPTYIKQGPFLKSKIDNVAVKFKSFVFLKKNHFFLIDNQFLIINSFK